MHPTETFIPYGRQAISDDDVAALPPVRHQPRSRWVPVRWAELPGFGDDPLHEAWNAWLKSCERPGPVFGPLCSEVRRLSLGDGQAQRAWLMARRRFRVCLIIDPQILSPAPRSATSASRD